MLELDGVRLLTDPVVRNRVGPLVRSAPSVDRAATQAIDLVLLSHLHGDHADPASLRRVGAETPIVAPRGAALWLRRRGLSKVSELSAGGSMTFGPLTITAVGARHSNGRYPFRSFGPAAEAIGFVVRNSRVVYFAGDTDLFPGMAELEGPVDAALLPVGGWGPGLGPGHLDPFRAAQAARLIAPQIAIPIHWGTLALPRPLRWSNPYAAAGHEFADLAARLAPDVEVRVLAPGGRTALP
jgi:L-ascorbate metabolism protein UlaG (beta-lactamase superfamily)